LATESVGADGEQVVLPSGRADESGRGIFVLGGQVNGGRVITNWPGLQNEQLYDRADLAVTTDYRQV